MTTKLPIVGRADLLKGLRTGDEAELARLLGYEYRSKAPAPKKEPDPTKIIDETEAEPSPPIELVNNQLSEIPFLIPQRIEFFGSGETLDDRPKVSGSSRAPEKAVSPSWRHLMEGPALAALLRKILAPRTETKRIDEDQLVREIARGELTTTIPRAKIHKWVSSLHIVIDRSWWLSPYSKDQLHVLRVLEKLAPTIDITPVIFMANDRAFRVADKAGERLDFDEVEHLLVLGDLGALAGQTNHDRDFWLGIRRNIQGKKPIALTPAPQNFYDADLHRAWDIHYWDHAVSASAVSIREINRQAEEFLAFLSVARQVTPQFIRAARLAIFPEAPACVEAYVWRSGRFLGEGIRPFDALIFDHINRTSLLGKIKAKDRRFDIVHRVHRDCRLGQERHAGLGAPTYYSEIIDLPDGLRCRVAQDDLASARAYFANLGGDEDQQLQNDAHAWVSWLANNSTAAWDVDEFSKIAVSVENNERSIQDGKEPPPKPPLKKLSIAQNQRGLAFTTSDPQGAWVIDLPSDNGKVDIRLGETQSNDLPADVLPDWVSDSGEDEFGKWLAFEVSGIVQRLRWCPPGRFMMGSPEEEDGRYGDESPQTEIAFEAGFWLFDTAVSQDLWKAVMGDTPSHFKGGDLPVESVSWDDVQVFVDRLNADYPGLELRLPSEAEWEYGCRAGSIEPFDPTIAVGHDGQDITSEEVNFNGNDPIGRARKSAYARKNGACEGGAVSAKCLGFLAYAWECVGMVCRYLVGGPHRGRPGGRPASAERGWRGSRASQGVAWRVLERRGRELPLRLSEQRRSRLPQQRHWISACPRSG